MGQKVNPISLRLEKTNKKFDSCWHSDFYYSERLSQDLRVKSYLSAFFKQIQCTGDKFSFISLHKKVRLLAGYFDPEESRFYRCHHFELTLITRDEKEMKKKQQLAVFAEEKNKKKNKAGYVKTGKISSDFSLGIKQKRLRSQGDLTSPSNFFSKVTCKLRKPLSKKRFPFSQKITKSPGLKGKSLLSLISTCNPFLPTKRKLFSLGPLETSLLGGENRMSDKRFESWRKRFFVSSLIFFLFLKKWRHPLATKTAFTFSSGTTSTTYDFDKRRLWYLPQPPLVEMSKCRRRDLPLFSKTLFSPSTSPEVVPLEKVEGVDTTKLSCKELFTISEKKVSEKKGLGKRSESCVEESEFSTFLVGKKRERAREKRNQPVQVEKKPLFGDRVGREKQKKKGLLLCQNLGQKQENCFYGKGGDSDKLRLSTTLNPVTYGTPDTPLSNPDILREETSLLHSKPLVGQEKKEIPFFKPSKERVGFRASNRLVNFDGVTLLPQQNYKYETSFFEEFLAKNNFSRRVFVWGLQRVKETVNRISKTRNWCPKTGGKEYISNLKEVLRKELNSDVDFVPYRGISENQSAEFLAQEVVYYLQRRIPFRRFKYRLLGEIQNKKRDEWKKIKGFRISCSGRVGGRSKKARRARGDSFQWGQTSLHVFSSKLSFAYKNGLTRFGQVGVKVWICYK